MPFPLVNVLTKIDNLSATSEPLPFNLDYYTEVQDLDYLLPHLEAEQNNTTVSHVMSDPSSDPTYQFPETRFTKLNRALIDLVQDFGLIGFETLAVEDKTSMTNLLHAIDRASGYVFGTDEGTNDSVWQVAMQEGWGGKMDVRDVQERWIDRKDEFDEMEKKVWEEEGRREREKSGRAGPEVRRVPQDGETQASREKPNEKDGDDDDLEALQEQFMREKEQQDSTAKSGIDIVRK